MHTAHRAARPALALACVLATTGPQPFYAHRALGAHRARADAAPPTDRPAPAGGMVITEILAAVPTGPEGDANRDGARHVSGDEFIELANTSDAPINLRGYRLTDRDAGKAAGIDFRFPALTVQPRQVVVLFNGNASNIPGPVGDAQRPPASTNDRFAGAWVFSIRAASQRMSLANAADRVSLFSPDGGLIQEVSWGPTEGPAPDGAARWSAPVVDGVSVTRLVPGGPFVAHPRAAGLFSPGIFPPNAPDAPSPTPPSPTPPSPTPPGIPTQPTPTGPSRLTLPERSPRTPTRDEPPQAPPAFVPRIPPLTPAPAPAPTTPRQPEAEPLPGGVAARVAVTNLTQQGLVIDWVVLWSVGSASAADVKTGSVQPGGTLAHDFPTGGPSPLFLVRIATENPAPTAPLYRIVHAGERASLKVSKKDGLLVVDR